MQLSRTEAVRAALAAGNGVTGQLTAGVSALPLASGSVAIANHGIAVKALTANTDSVWVGIGSATTGTGTELNPGEGVTINIDSLTKVYVISDTAAQKVSYILT
tara:strand:+ start:891 stop:1202 length:312 start_codon:yes stop_codon:yes gene_type:complete